MTAWSREQSAQGCRRTLTMMSPAYGLMGEGPVQTTSAPATAIARGHVQKPDALGVSARYGTRPGLGCCRGRLGGSAQTQSA